MPTSRPTTTRQVRERGSSKGVKQQAEARTDGGCQRETSGQVQELAAHTEARTISYAEDDIQGHGADEGQDRIDNWYPTREWDPFVGCEPVSAGCKFCYGARRVYEMQPNHPSVKCVDGIPMFTGKVFAASSFIRVPVDWETPETVFFCAHCDPYQPGIGDGYLKACFDVMAEARQHDFNVLTKFPGRAVEFHGRYDAPPVNVRLGISAESQRLLDERWALLKQIPAARYILSLQPLLGPVRIPEDFGPGWVVAMREVSGRQAWRQHPDTGKVVPHWLTAGSRPCKPEWFRDLRDQCEAIGVQFCWETTAEDTREMQMERVRASREGHPYDTQSHDLAMAILNNFG